MVFLLVFRVAIWSSIANSKQKGSLILMLFLREIITLHSFLDSSPSLAIYIPWVMRTTIILALKQVKWSVLLHSLASLWVLLNSVSSFFILTLFTCCPVTKHFKFSCIRNNHLTFTDSVGQEFGKGLRGIAYVLQLGEIDSDSAGGNSNNCRLELSGDFFIHLLGT